VSSTSSEALLIEDGYSGVFAEPSFWQSRQLSNTSISTAEPALPEHAFFPRESANPVIHHSTSGRPASDSVVDPIPLYLSSESDCARDWEEGFSGHMNEPFSSEPARDWLEDWSGMRFERSVGDPIPPYLSSESDGASNLTYRSSSSEHPLCATDIGLDEFERFWNYSINAGPSAPTPVDGSGCNASLH